MTQNNNSERHSKTPTNLVPGVVPLQRGGRLGVLEELSRGRVDDDRVQAGVDRVRPPLALVAEAEQEVQAPGADLREEMFARIFGQMRTLICTKFSNEVIRQNLPQFPSTIKEEELDLLR